MFVSRVRGVGSLSLLAIQLWQIAPAAQAPKPATVTFTKDVAPDPEHELRLVSSPRRDRADVADDVRGGAAVGACDSQGGRRARDAAVGG